MPSETRVDVLIIGAGPAGLMGANALATAGVSVRIIDIRSVGVAAGQADGITPRTIEVLQSYGLAERFLREARHIYMAATYNPANNGGIECTQRLPIVVEPTARYPFITSLRQGAIEALFLDSLKDKGVEVERPRQPLTLEISEDVEELKDPLSYPVKVTVEHLDAIDDDNKTEVIRAKFVIGTDGAHSWVRKTVGIQMEGEQSNFIWGVVDVIAETNFPDVRNLCAIRSANGSCSIIPREGDKNRVYIQLSDTDVINPETGRVDKSRMSPQKLLSVARKILHPYELAEPKEIEWWTVYIIGQRVASSYSVKDRVFIAGDACHTHSPTGGQGMNASMGDTHNLAWKLVQVLRGWARPSLLKTYEQERREFAQELISVDKAYATTYSNKAKTTENGDGISTEQFRQAAQKRKGFLSGIGIRYAPSEIVDPTYQTSANELTVGQRMPPHVFVRATDTCPVDIQDMLPANAHFKLLFFVGRPNATRLAELHILAKQLVEPSGILHKYATDGNMSAVFDVITILAAQKNGVNYLTLPAFLRPHWSSVLLDDTNLRNTQGGRAYESFGIDPEQITLVVVRPDGYVGTIVPSSAIADLDKYFNSFLISRGQDAQ